MKEIAGDDFAAVRHACCGEDRVRASRHSRKLEQGALKMRMATQDRGEEHSAVAAYVGDGADIGEVVALRHDWGEGYGSFQHRRVEGGGFRGMLCQEVQPRYPVGGIKSGLAGSNCVQDVLEGLTEGGPPEH